MLVSADAPISSYFTQLRIQVVHHTMVVCKHNELAFLSHNSAHNCLQHLVEIWPPNLLQAAGLL
jgi:hypothetical protein